MDWTPYPNRSNGEWASVDGLILTVMPSGSWGVFDPLGRYPARSEPDWVGQLLSPIGMDEGKRRAMNAATEMLLNS